MTLVLTTEGAAHLQLLTDGDPLVHDYSRLIFGEGNDVPTATDEFDDLTSKTTDESIMEVAKYAKVGDDDPRNSGRGSDVWTWHYVLEPSGNHMLASNLHIVDALGSGTDLSMVSAKQIVAKLAHQRMLVWFNAKVGEVSSLIIEFEEPELAPKKGAFTPRAFALAAYANGTVSETDRHMARPGETVTVFGLFQGSDGKVLQPADITNVSATVYEKTRIGNWRRLGFQPVEAQEKIVTDDPRYPHREGYNVSANWTLPSGRGVAAEYHIEVTVGDGGGQTRESWRIDVDLPPTGIGR